MGKKFVISEEQYKKALAEGITLNADVAAAGGDVKRAVDNTKREAQKNGVKMDDATIELKASDTNEGRLITTAQLRENRLKILKKNSEVYTVREFMEKINKKKL